MVIKKFHIYTLILGQFCSVQKRLKYLKKFCVLRVACFESFSEIFFSVHSKFWIFSVQILKQRSNILNRFLLKSSECPDSQRRRGNVDKVGFKMDSCVLFPPLKADAHPSDIQAGPLRTPVRRGRGSNGERVKFQLETNWI